MLPMIKIRLFPYRPDLRQQRIFVNLNSPSLVLRQMQMQKIKLVQRHFSNKQLDLVYGIEISPDIKHKASDFILRLILIAINGIVRPYSNSSCLSVCRANTFPASPLEYTEIFSFTSSRYSSFQAKIMRKTNNNIIPDRQFEFTHKIIKIIFNRTVDISFVKRQRFYEQSFCFICFSNNGVGIIWDIKKPFA